MIEKRVKTELQQLVSTEIKWDCSLAPFTSFGVGGPAGAVIVVEHLTELADLLECFSKNRLRYCFIGRGTNILVDDAGFDGVVLLFGKNCSKITLLEESETDKICIQVGAGCSLAKLLNWCSTKGFSGLEFASGIPGSVGGAVIMNAGAWGGEMTDVVSSVSTFSMANGEEKIARSRLDFGYRKWRNQRNKANEKRLVVSAEIVLQKGTKTTIESRCHEYLTKRKEKQPKGLKNAGSFFKNPPGDSAGRLIEAAGLKGTQYGDAMVSLVHANFFVNTGKAKADDIKQLMQIVVKKVREESGVELQTEVHFL